MERIYSGLLYSSTDINNKLGFMCPRCAFSSLAGLCAEVYNDVNIPVRAFHQNQCEN